MFIAFLCSTSFTQAAITFSITPNNTNITAGSSAVFNINITSDANVTLGGYSLNVIAGAGNTTGGVFSAGTFDFLVGDPGQAWDLTSRLGQAFSTADTGKSGGTGVGNSLQANVTTRLGTLTLTTTGVAPATYQMSLASLSAIAPNGNFIAGGTNGAVNGGAINYTITAVPEPSSIFLSCIVGTCFLASRMRTRKSEVLPPLASQ
ncbi:MAG TPA: PEP-CTERM sorting domain-containing protein [Pirellula sp.]|nr:PEP-CTERM sorting domain-containing protein [Pirellula sp.]